VLVHPEWIRAVCFDAVGTLLFPQPPAAEMYARVAARYGYSIELDTIATRFQRAFGRQEALDGTGSYQTSEARERQRWRAIVQEVLVELSDTTAAFEELWEHFAQPAAWTAFPDVRACMQQLHAAGLQIGVGSNLDSRLRRMLRGRSDVEPVDFVVISSEIGWRKPAAEFFAALVESSGVARHELLFVGDDAVNDAAGARMAGLQSLLLNRRGRVADKTELTSLAALTDLLRPGS
jgi:putative hydrolase of the HAD superfamily